MKVDLVIKDISELITMRFDTSPVRLSRELEFEIIKDGCIVIKNGKIIDVGSKRAYKKYVSNKVLSAEGKVVTPGLVDPHTHLIFAGERAGEFEMRCKGASYKKIAESGGGIVSTVRHVRESSKKKLFHLAHQRLHDILKHGTTTVEIKSGYGLNFNDEIKMLQVARRLGKETVLDVAVTFLGAHIVPVEYENRRIDYIKFLIEEMMPYIATHNLADFCDVFCDEGAYNVKEAGLILVGGIVNNLKPKIHCDEFKRLGATLLATKIGAVSCDHLIVSTDEDVVALKNSNTIAVILPTTSLFLGGEKYSPARKFIDNGVFVALGTDFNPGTSTCKSMQLVMQIACSVLKMTPLEALVASTINSSSAILMQKKVGSLEVGKQADLIIWNAKKYQEIPYYLGENLIGKVVKRGKLVVDNGNSKV